MPTLRSVQNRADGFLNNIRSHLESDQAAHLARRGIHFQGLATHTVRPAYLTADPLLETIPDRLASKPSDQIENWNQAFNRLNNVPMPFEMIINVYDGPSGKGYVANMGFDLDGSTYRKSVNFGPETHRDRDWFEVIQDRL
jgi:hypothetical protein